MTKPLARIAGWFHNVRANGRPEMLRRIILENFMSHGRTEIDLADGLTVLTGPNNCGKSAVVAALQILATNGRSTHVLRHGEKACRITVETDDGHTICWERNKKNTVKYTIDGEDIHRVGTSIPPDLHEVLRLDRVETKVGKSTHEYDIHFGEQKSPVFLLGESGGRAASFFASSSDASRLVEMQHRHRTNLISQRREETRLVKELEKTASRLSSLSPLDDIAGRIATADKASQTIEKSQATVRRLQEQLSHLFDGNKKVRRMQTQFEVLNHLDDATTTPGELRQARDAATKLNALLRGITRLQTVQSDLKSCTTALHPLQPAPAQENPDSIRRLIGQLKANLLRKRTATAILACCQAVSPPPALAPAAECRIRLQQLKVAAAACSRLAAMGRTLAHLNPAPRLADTRPLIERINALTTARRNTDTTRRVYSVVLSLEKPPGQNELSHLRTLIRQLSNRKDQAKTLQDAANRLDQLLPPIEKSSSETLRITIERLSDSLHSVDTARRTFEACRQETLDCEAQIRGFVKANPRCSACGGVIDPNTLLAGVPGVHDHAGPASKDETPAFRRKG